MLGVNLARYVLPGDLKLINIKRYKGGYLWEVEKVRQEFEICPRCATPSQTRAGRCFSVVRDEPLRGDPLWLKIHKHRYFCKTCRKPFTEPVSIVWPRRRSTQRFRKFVAKACHVYVDLSRVRKDLRVSSGFTYQVYYEQIEIKLRETKGRRWPKILGIDEHFFKRTNGYTEFVTVFTDIKKLRLFDMALGKSVKAIMEQMQSIPGCEDVKVVVMDLSGGYRALVKKLFPNAVIVADKFHALRLLTPAIMKAGKDIHGHRQELKMRRLLLRSRKKLDYFLRCEVDSYLKNHPELAELYWWKERLFEFYRIRGFARAVRAFSKLLQEMKCSSLSAVQKLYRTLKRWKQEILVYFEHRYTNAITEAMNNRGKLVQRRGYGYKSFKNYRLRTLSACLF